MKKLNTLLLLTLLPLTSHAYDAYIDGIYYNFDINTKQATVTFRSSIARENQQVYTDDVVIPGFVIFNDTKYDVTSIGKSAFNNCTGLKSVTIPNSVKEIDGNAFLDCSALESVQITNLEAWCKISFSDYASNPLYYAHHLFIDGNEIKDLVIPNSVTSIGERTFSGCSSLTSVTIPNNVTSIGNSAFLGCSGLTSIIISNSISSISRHTFYGCSGLTSITIPNSVTSISSYAFYGCNNLATVYLGNNLKSIGEKAFSYCSGLKNITIPNSVTEIEKQAFSYCENLTSVTLSNSLTKIESEVFQNCIGLTSVTIPENVIDVGGIGTFAGCTGLTSVVIPKKVESIGFNVFDGCTNLADIYCYAVNPPSTTPSAFLVKKQGYSKKQFKSDIIIHVPSESINTYRNADTWGTFRSIVALPTVVVEDIAINETNFPDENFRHWVLSQSYGNDGFLTEEEIADITQISVIGENIQDLKGIEYFTALRILTCWGNQLTSLDLSKNKSLEQLFCSDNQLTSLDLSKNTELMSLECYSNQLTTLDVSKNTALMSLDCSDNQLTSLDVSGCTALNYLYCYSNKLTSLNVSKNTALIDLTCDNNRLTSLDVSKNTELTDLYCEFNQLISLDLSKNTELTTLYCYQNQIKGAEMDALVESLPATSDGDGTMMVIYNENEGNVMTTTQVAAAKVKGWTPYFTEGELDEYDDVIWIEYAGRNDDVLRGDANDDGEIGMPDVMFIVNYLLGNPSASFNEEAADANLDGEIGMPDVMFIVNYILNGKFPDEE